MTGEQAQAIRDMMAETIEIEGPKTRRVLEAVPNENRDYRPDPKSRTAWELATHLAVADSWWLDCIISGRFDRSKLLQIPPTVTDSTTLAGWYEGNLSDRLARLRALTTEQLLEPVQFFTGVTRPAVSWLTPLAIHSAHHRGQLCAYLRAAGSKVPAIFGVSADENLMVKAAGA